MIKTIVYSVVLSILVAGFTATQALAAAPSATLSVTTDKGSYQVGETIVATVSVTSLTEAVSAVDLRFSYPNQVSYSSVNTTSSVFSTEVSPISTSGNVIRLVRARLSSGYTGSNGLIATVSFTANSAVTGGLTFDQGNSSTVAFSDSSNVLQTVSNANFSVAGGTPTPTPTAVATPVATSTPTATPIAPALPSTGSPFVVTSIVLTLLGAALLTYSKK